MAGSNDPTYRGDPRGEWAHQHPEHEADDRPGQGGASPTQAWPGQHGAAPASAQHPIGRMPGAADPFAGQAGGAAAHPHPNPAFDAHSDEHLHQIQEALGHRGHGVAPAPHETPAAHHPAPPASVPTDYAPPQFGAYPGPAAATTAGGEAARSGADGLSEFSEALPGHGHTLGGVAPPHIPEGAAPQANIPVAGFSESASLDRPAHEPPASLSGLYDPPPVTQPASDYYFPDAAGSDPAAAHGAAPAAYGADPYREAHTGVPDAGHGSAPVPHAPGAEDAYRQASQRDPYYANYVEPTGTTSPQGAYSTDPGLAHAGSPDPDYAAHYGASHAPQPAYGAPHAAAAGAPEMRGTYPASAAEAAMPAPADQVAPAHPGSGPYAPGYEGGYTGESGAESAGGDIGYYAGPPQEAPKSRRGLFIIGAILGAAAIGGGLGIVYNLMSGGEESKPAYLAAKPGKTKVAPKDAGGKVFPHQNKKVFGSPLKSSGTGGGERIVPRVEPVTARSGTAGGGATAPAKSASSGTGGLETGAPMPRRVRTVRVNPDGTFSRIPAKTAKPATAKPAAAPIDSDGGASVEFPGMVVEGLSSGGGAGAAPAASPKPRAPAKPILRGATKPAAPKPAPAPAVAVTTPSPAPSLGAAAGAGGAYVIQVGAHTSRLDALSDFADMRQRYQSLLGNKVQDIQEVTIKKKQWFRLRLGPPVSKDKAYRLCGALKAAGHKRCIVKKL